MNLKTQISDGINLYMIPDDKFKTFRAGAIFHTPLSRKTATKNALIPMLLTSGTKNFPDRGTLYKELLELYGAQLSTDVEKRGEIHALSVFIDTAAGRYVRGDDVEEKAFSLFSEILLNPLQEDGAFNSEALEREKSALKKQIEGMINDKRRYALTRCIEEMCHGEAYSVRQWGETEDMDDITPENLYSHYTEIINNSPVDFIVTGCFNRERVEGLIKKIAQKLGPRVGEYPKTILTKRVPESKEVFESSDILQGKLVMGFSTSVSPEDDMYYTLMMLNGVFGGGPSSKLFENVREKMSLCYYASSGLIREKGIMLAQAGIDFVNFEKARDEIVNQLEDIKKGVITPTEFENARGAILNSLTSYKDDLKLITGYYAAQSSFSKIHTIEETAEKIKSVTMEQVIHAARQIEVDTIYFLRGTKAEV